MISGKNPPQRGLGVHPHEAAATGDLGGPEVGPGPGTVFERDDQGSDLGSFIERSRVSRIDMWIYIYSLYHI